MQNMQRLKHGLLQVAGWLFYVSLLMLIALALPNSIFDPESKDFIFLIGAVGIWRYSMGATHFVRGMLFLYVVYPMLRRKVRKLGSAADPSHVYLMVTSFRIDALTTAQVYSSVIREAIACGYPTTVVCSLVEMSDELLVKSLWEKFNPPDRVTLDFVRIAGTGKRDGLAYGFRAISRHLPDENAVVAVIDGDTVLGEGVVRKTVPWFKLFGNVGGLTTNEFCEVRGGYIMSEWHKLRFAQRHINMCSMALSKRVLTMTGRMSVFRAAVVTNPEFIADVENDSLQHWRLGRFKFLTGDDKSSWFSLMRLGYDTFYVPDAAINTVEHPPEKSFIKASRKLMYRWYGNNLRQNSRALGLGIRRLGLFTSVVLFDQRVSMWTSLLGLTVAVIASLKFGMAYLLVYLLWIGITRLILTIMLLCSGHKVGPA
ncbi:MAG: glycosyltransferase family 2 protein, partial [Pseudomonas sp.]